MLLGTVAYHAFLCSTFCVHLHLLTSAVLMSSSLSGLCAHGHSLPRCRRTLLSLSTIATQRCNNCHGTSLIPTDMHERMPHVCTTCWGTTIANGAM
jgi:hypothetical protein